MTVIPSASSWYSEVIVKPLPLLVESQHAATVAMPPPVVTSDTRELISYALHGIAQLLREGYRYKKAGVILTALVPAHQIQVYFFDQHDWEQSHKLMVAINTIQHAMGHRNDALYCPGTAATLEHAVCASFAPVYDEMGGASR